MKTARPAFLFPLALSVALSLGVARTLLAEEPAARRPVEDVIRLWNAKLSEDFIRRHVKGTGKVYDLSVDEIVRCREAGIPESLIDVMLATKPKEAEPVVAAAAPAPPVAASAPVAAAPAPATPVPPAPVPGPKEATAPAAAAEPPPVAMPVEPRRWGGLVRRNPGVVLFKSAWDAGTLELKGESLRWSDAADPSKNLLIPVGALTEHFLACVEGRGTADCFEWGFRTRDDVYRFRDAGWADGRAEKVEDVFSTLKKSAPALRASTVPMKGK